MRALSSAGVWSLLTPEEDTLSDTWGSTSVD